MGSACAALRAGGWLVMWTDTRSNGWSKRSTLLCSGILTTAFSHWCSMESRPTLRREAITAQSSGELGDPLSEARQMLLVVLGPGLADPAVGLF
jgi:hypothetical protein